MNAMVNSEVIIQTIKKMLDSGIDVSVVRSALKDLGLNEGEIDSYFAQVKGGSKGRQEEETGLDEEEKDSIARKASERIKEHLDERNEEEDLLHASTHLRLDEHAEKLDEIHAKISSMQKEGFDVEDFLLKMDAFERELRALKEDVTEIKALTSSVQQLMKKVLETQREILTKRK
ncbi:MAG: hypothetical protein AB1467_06020 [Candidatus Diapherotrites archaeon]